MNFPHRLRAIARHLVLCWRSATLLAALLVVPIARRSSFAYVPLSIKGTQPGIVGRYVLRTVNGKSLPVTIPLDDPHRAIQVTEGVLVLNPDGTYLCRTTATTVYLGLKEPFADTLAGGYTVLQSGAIQLGHKGVKADTITTSGFKIAWTHPVRTAQGLFVYIK